MPRVTDKLLLTRGPLGTRPAPLLKPSVETMNAAFAPVPPDEGSVYDPGNGTHFYEYRSGKWVEKEFPIKETK